MWFYWATDAQTDPTAEQDGAFGGPLSMTLND